MSNFEIGDEVDIVIRGRIVKKLDSDHYKDTVGYGYYSIVDSQERQLYSHAQYMKKVGIREHN